MKPRHSWRDCYDNEDCGGSTCNLLRCIVRRFLFNLFPVALFTASCLMFRLCFLLVILALICCYLFCYCSGFFFQHANAVPMGCAVLLRLIVPRIAVSATNAVNPRPQRARFGPQQLLRQPPPPPADLRLALDLLPQLSPSSHPPA